MQLPRHYLVFPEAFILVYDPSDPASLDILAGIKSDIDKNKDKKEVRIANNFKCSTRLTNLFSFFLKGYNHCDGQRVRK